MRRVSAPATHPLSQPVNRYSDRSALRITVGDGFRFGLGGILALVLAAMIAFVVLIASGATLATIFAAAARPH